MGSRVERKRSWQIETGTGEGGVEVDALEQGVDLNGGLDSGRKGALGTLISGTQATEGMGVRGQVKKCKSVGAVLERAAERETKRNETATMHSLATSLDEKQQQDILRNIHANWQ